MSSADGEVFSECAVGLSGGRWRSARSTDAITSSSETRSNRRGPASASQLFLLSVFSIALLPSLGGRARGAGTISRASAHATPQERDCETISGASRPVPRCRAPGRANAAGATYVKARATIAPPAAVIERNPRPSTFISGTSCPAHVQALSEVEPTGIEPVTSCLQSRGGHAGASRYGGFGSAEMAL
jgi:hypothetical protein